MNIVLNGKVREIGDSISLLQLLDELSLHPQQVAVEINREIVKRDRYEHYYIQDGDEIEILRFVGGGNGKGVHDD